jgi:predicted nucleic acid-binding protein
MGPPPRLFLDASVLIAAAGSAGGGSALVLEVGRAKLAAPLLTRMILREAERNVQGKLDREALLRFYRLIAELEPELLPIPRAEELGTASQVVEARDAHVLAGARAGAATHLITLDRRHFLQGNQRQAILPIVACTPGEFLQGFLASGAHPSGPTPS